MLRSLLVRALVLAACIAPWPALGQSSTCGWPSSNPQDAPSTLLSLRNRSPQAPKWLHEVEELLFRWYRECDATAARVATRSLQAARERTNSSDPLLLAWLGIALVRGPEVQVEKADGVVLRSTHKLSNAEREGARLLAQVTAAEGWLEVAEELAGVAVATRKEETLRLAGRTLLKAAESFGDSGLWSPLAEVELVRGDHDAAERAARRAIAAGSPRGMRVGGIVRMLAGNDAAGAEIYLRGLRAARDDRDIRPFFDDLRMLLGEDELADWRNLDGGRADWIERKWQWRAHMAGVQVAERLAVNARRLDEAMRRYWRQSFRGAPGRSAVWEYSNDTWRQPLDDRGVIFVRHGEPVAELRMRGFVSRVAWVYGGVGTMLYEFDRAADRPDHFLAEPYPICQGQHVLLRAPEGTPRRNPGSGYPAGGDLIDWAATLSVYDPGLAAFYFRCARSPEFAGLSYIPERERARRAAEAAWNSESGVSGIRQPLVTAVNLYAFGASPGPELVSYVSVAAGKLRRLAATGPQSGGFDVLLSLGDPVSETITQLDTTITFRTAAPLAPDAVISAALTLRTEPRDRARVVLTLRNQADPAQGQVSSTTWRIPGFNGGLLLSDLVVADQRAGVLRRGSHQLAPVPGHVVRTGAGFRLYYELYGAQGADPLSVSIRVVPGKDESVLARIRALISSRQALTIEFEEPASVDADGVMRVERDIGAELEPGAYALVVTVRSGRTGETASADTNLIVMER